MRWVLVCAAVLVIALPGCEDECDCFPGQVCYQDRCVHALFDTTLALTPAVDVILAIEASGGTVWIENAIAKSIRALTDVLEQKFTQDFHIAVVTLGMESSGCGPCDASHMSSCINSTGENGRFQDLKGCMLSIVNPGECVPEPDSLAPDFDFDSDPSCRVVTPSNVDCLYDPETYRGTLLVGPNGCGYERGLASIRAALQKNLLEGYNEGFLREEALLGVVMITHEEDCGEVGEATEGLPEAGGDICYRAAAGVGPNGETEDSTGKPYVLTPVADYFRALLDAKGGRAGMVKFAAIVGVKDLSDLSTTTIEYEQNGSNWKIADICTSPAYGESGIPAFPGTRYIKLAQMFGLGSNGFVDTICQADYTDTLTRVGQFLSCQNNFPLGQAVQDVGSIIVLVNGTVLPRYTCSAYGQWVQCTGLEDTSCSVGECVGSYTLEPESTYAPHGSIVFADHTNPCTLPDGQVRISVIPATE